MSPKTRNAVLLVLISILAGLAIWTLLPFPASKPNDLGYVSTCPFAPWSSLALLLTAGLIWAIRQYFLRRVE